MYSAEVLSQLRSLNWLAQEIRRVPPDSREGAHLQGQIDAVRTRLPNSILDYHDSLSRGGRTSTAQVIDGTCSGCHVRLPLALREKLTEPGRFGLCPKCGLFVWAAESNAPAPESDVAHSPLPKSP